MVLSFFLPLHLQQAKDRIVELLFFAALFSTGFKFRPSEVTRELTIMALLPSCCELFVICLYGVQVLGFTFADSLVLGLALFAVGDDVVVSQSDEIGRRVGLHPLLHR